MLAACVCYNLYGLFPFFDVREREKKTSIMTMADELCIFTSILISVHELTIHSWNQVLKTRAATLSLLGEPHPEINYSHVSPGKVN
jgi:hypothetical protein